MYRAHGKHSATSVKRRFKSWNAAVVAAGLAVSGERGVSEPDLFENLHAVWVALGYQPRKRQMAKPLSRYTHHPYVERYGGWLSAIKAFLAAYERDESDLPIPVQSPCNRGQRDPSLRLRFLVMRRDGFRCCHCGASPAISPGVALHVDHVVAWSVGGPTTLENLQTLCAVCNLGKSDLSNAGPSLHPTCYSGFRPLPQAGELQRWGSACR